MAKTDDELDQVLAGYGLSNEEDGFLVVHLLNQYLLEKDGGTGKDVNLEEQKPFFFGQLNINFSRQDELLKRLDWNWCHRTLKTLEWSFKYLHT